MIVQYAHDFATLEKAQEFVTKVILAANKETDAVVNMTPQLEPFIQKLDPFEFVVKAARWKEQNRPVVPVTLNLMFSNDCESNCAYCYAHRRHVPENELLPTDRWKAVIR